MSLTPTEPTLILSDLHLGHRACLIKNPEQLGSLFRDCATVIFNGDTAEMRTPGDQLIGRRMAAELARVCHHAGAKTLFVNGNHDPTISHLNHLELANGLVLVTHGDILFLGVAPWSKDARHYLNAHKKILKELGPEALSDLEHQLRASKQASLALQGIETSATEGKARRLGVFMRQLWPPDRPFKILKAWLELPDRGAELCAIYRPQARFVLLGHTHYPGIWQRRGRTVINTGSFVPYLPAHAVLLDSGRLSIRKIERRRGAFEFGQTLNIARLEA